MQNKDERIIELTYLNDDLENYFVNTIIPQIFVDAELRLRKFTPPAMKQFDIKREDVGKLLFDIAENRRFPSIMREIQQVMRTGEILQQEVETADDRWYQMSIHPYILQKENKSDGVIITFIDITLRIKDLKEQQHLSSENELLLDTIAHDLKGPLSGLTMAFKMLKKQQLEVMDKYPTLLSGMGGSIDLMNKVLNDLVRTRWHGNRYEAEAENLNLEDIIEDVRHTLAARLKETNTLFKTNIENSEIFFSRRKLRSILINLVFNALKYSSPERRPEIYLESYSEDGYHVISVSDNGIGIEKKDQANIFEKYWRGNTGIEGYGVGLYLVKEMLKNANGRITLESNYGKGSTFCVYIKTRPA